MLLALLDQVYFAECARVGHFFRLEILGGEEKLLCIQQQHSVRPAGLDHLVGLLERHAKRLLADDVLTRFSHGNGHLAMQGVRGSDGDCLYLRILAPALCSRCIPGESCTDRQGPRVRCGGGSNGHHSHIVLDHPDRRGVTIRLKLRADDAYAHRTIFHGDLFCL